MTKQQKQTRRPEGLVRNVKAYASSRLAFRSEHAKQSSPMLAAFEKAYGTRSR